MMSAMNNRTLVTLARVCFLAASFLACLALYHFAVHQFQFNLGWTLVGFGTLIVAGGLVVQNIAREQSELATRQQSQVELLKSEMEQRQSAVDVLADGLDVAIFICDLRATILYANRRATEMFKFDSPVNRSILAVTLSHDLEQLVFEACRLGEKQEAELNFAYPEERVGMAAAWPQPHGDRVFVSIYEITNLRRLERIRQDFVSNVSHELRTPLTIIRAMAETLLDDPDADKQLHDKYLEKITTEVDRLSLIANDLLILSAAESNTAKKNDCDIADTFRGAVNQLQPKARGKGLELSFDGPEHLSIDANTIQMTQVALNLVDNSINYTAEGSVKVKIEPGDDQVSIQVSDTGIGISGEHLPRIFERFYRVDKGRSRATGGTGLGLSIVKHIVEAHGGRVRVESTLNKGSIFTVELPIGTPSEL